MLTNSVAEALCVSSESADKLDDLVARPNGLSIKSAGDWMLASQWAINATVHNSLLKLFRDNFPLFRFSVRCLRRSCVST